MSNLNNSSDFTQITWGRNNRRFYESKDVFSYYSLVYRTCLDECEATQVSSNYMKNKKVKFTSNVYLNRAFSAKGGRGGGWAEMCVFRNIMIWIVFMVMSILFIYYKYTRLWDSKQYKPYAYTKHIGFRQYLCYIKFSNHFETSFCEWELFLCLWGHISGIQAASTPETLQN